MIKHKVAFSTLGCRLNQYETDGIASNFIKNNFEVVSFNNYADVYIINTCSVTNKSDAKSRNLINRFYKLNPNSVIVVTGCYAQTDAEKIKAMKGVTYVVSNNKKHGIYSLVEKHLSRKQASICDIQNNLFAYNNASKTLHTRSYLKIQDGCNEMCSYCKIPFSRGPATSNKYSDVLDNFKQLVDYGSKEIILTGINLGDYNHNDKSFLNILEGMLLIKGDFRIHISSIEPNKVSDNIIDILSDEKFVKHIHLPLQSGSDKILVLMNRNYSRSEYIKTVLKLRDKIKNINITTDLMVGFPSENDDDFNDSFKLIKELNITKVHTFKYSIRDNTQAALLKSQVDDGVKSERSLRIRNLSSDLEHKYNSSLIGDISRVIIEKKISSNIYSGYNDYYVRVNFTSKDELKIGQYCNVAVNNIKDKDSNSILVGKGI